MTSRHRISTVEVRRPRTSGGHGDGRAAMRWLWPGHGTRAMTAEGGSALTAATALVPEQGAVGQASPIDGAATNVVTNPSFEVDTTGWSAFNAATALRSTVEARVGTASLLVTTTGAGADEGATQHAKIAVAASTTYTCSMWFKGASGSVHINANAYNSSDGYLTTFVGGATTLDGTWQRLTLTFTTTSTTAKVDLFALTWGTQAITFRVDGAQLEQRAHASGYIDGSIGTGYTWSGTAHASTSSRTAGRLRVHAGPLRPARGAIAAWVRPPWPSGAAPTTPRVFRWAASASEALELRYEHATTRWALLSAAGGVTTTLTSAVDSFSDGAGRVLVAAWTERALSLSVQGGTPVTASRAAVPAVGGTLVDLGSLDGASGHLWAPLGPIVAWDRPLEAGRLAVLGRLARALEWGELAARE